MSLSTFAWLLSIDTNAMPMLDHILLFLRSLIFLWNFWYYQSSESYFPVTVKYVNPITRLCIIRCSRSEYEKIWCAITFITSINNYPLFFNLLDLSGKLFRTCGSCYVLRKMMLLYVSLKLYVSLEYGTELSLPSAIIFSFLEDCWF